MQTTNHILLNHAANAEMIKTTLLPLSQDSPFLDLPGEVRNRIYSFLYAKPVEIHVELKFKPQKRTLVELNDGRPHTRALPYVGYLKFTPKPAVFLSLPQVCHQIRSETAMTIFDCAKFIFYDPPSAKEFVDRLNPSQRKSLRSLEIQIYDVGEMRALANWHSNQYVHWSQRKKNLPELKATDWGNVKVEFATSRLRVELPNLKSLVLKTSAYYTEREGKQTILLDGLELEVYHGFYLSKKTDSRDLTMSALDWSLSLLFDP